MPGSWLGQGHGKEDELAGCERDGTFIISAVLKVRHFSDDNNNAYRVLSTYCIPCSLPSTFHIRTPLVVPRAPGGVLKGQQP